MKKLLIYYNFILISVMTLSAFLNAETTSQVISSVLFYPLFVYFALQVLPRRQKALLIPNTKPSLKVKQSKVVPLTKEDDEAPRIRLDGDRRVFLKLIASAGVSVFFLSLFTKNAHAAFFGSVPGPGTVALKDTSGNPVDPAEKQPLDGYAISELDDSTPAYYGYLEKGGAWYIVKEDSAGGNYRYAKGASSFSTNWTNRASLTYDYYHNVF